MKKILSLMVILVLGLFALSGCGKKTQIPTGNDLNVQADN